MLLLRGKQSRGKNVLSRLYLLVFVCLLIFPNILVPTQHLAATDRKDAALKINMKFVLSLEQL